MRKYEYMHFRVPGTAMISTLEPHMKKLNELGAEGWQMSGMFYTPDATRMDHPVTIFMRRPIEEDEMPVKKGPGRPKNA